MAFHCIVIYDVLVTFSLVIFAFAFYLSMCVLSPYSAICVLSVKIKDDVFHSTLINDKKKMRI